MLGHLVGVEIEDPHGIGAVVAAVAGADAAVVDLAVEAVRVVVAGIDRADRLAGGIVAVLAHDRQEATRTSGYSPTQKRSMRSQCMARPSAISCLSHSPTLFSAWQATTQAPQPVQRSRSITIPHLYGLVIFSMMSHS